MKRDFSLRNSLELLHDVISPSHCDLKGSRWREMAAWQSQDCETPSAVSCLFVSSRVNAEDDHSKKISWRSKGFAYPILKYTLFLAAIWEPQVQISSAVLQEGATWNRDYVQGHVIPPSAISAGSFVKNISRTAYSNSTGLCVMVAFSFSGDQTVWLFFLSKWNRYYVGWWFPSVTLFDFLLLRFYANWDLSYWHRSHSIVIFPPQDLFADIHPVHFLNSRAHGIGVGRSQSPTRERDSIFGFSTGNGRLSDFAAPDQCPLPLGNNLYVSEPTSDGVLEQVLEHSQDVSLWVAVEICSASSIKVSNISLLFFFFFFNFTYCFHRQKQEP